MIGRSAVLAVVSAAAACSWPTQDELTYSSDGPAAPACEPPPGCYGWALLVLPECHQCWDGEWPEPEPPPQPPPPGLEITSPTGDPVVAESSIALSGYVVPQTGAVHAVTWKNDLTRASGAATLGPPAWDGGAYEWAATIPLGWGWNPIWVTAELDGGLTVEASIVITRDAAPPTVSIFGPTAGSAITTADAPIRLVVDARDDGGLVAASWRNQDTGAEGPLVIDTPAWGLVPVQRGMNRIVVTVEDVAGRTATDDLTVTCTAEIQEWRASWDAPVVVGGLAGLRAIADGERHVVALGVDGRVWQRGELPDGSSTSTPSVIAGVDRVVKVAAGFRHTLAIDEDGVVWSWGRYGQDGDPIPFGSDVPIVVPLPGPAIAVAAGFGFGLAALADGTVWGWGANDLGQLGDGTTTSRAEPVQVTGLDGARVASLAAGYGHALAASDDGRWWAWGWGRGFAGSTRLSAAPIDGPTGVIEVAAGLHSSFALDADGDVWAVGENPFGELGDGTQTDRAVPVQVVDLAGAVAIAAGSEYGVALLADGTVRAWGWFFPEVVTRPVPVPGLAGIIALGRHGSLFLLPPLGGATQQ